MLIVVLYCRAVHIVEYPSRSPGAQLQDHHGRGAVVYLCRGRERPAGASGLIRVVAAVIERQGRLLICQRRRGDPFELQWEFPGGKLRSSETPRAGLARELREELGTAARIGPEICRTRHRYRQFGDAIEIRFFAAGDMLPAPRNLAFERMVWSRPGDLPGYDFLPADRALVARLTRGDLARRLRRVWTARHPPPAPVRSRMPHVPGTVPLR